MIQISASILLSKKPQTVLERFRSLTPDQIAISMITVAELEYGARKSVFPEKNMAALQQFLSPFSLYNFEYAATVDYGILRAELETKGTPIGPLDMLIAAHALSLSFILVTNNEKEFSRVRALSIENWV